MWLSGNWHAGAWNFKDSVCFGPRRQFQSACAHPWALSRPLVSSKLPVLAVCDRKEVQDALACEDSLAGGFLRPLPGSRPLRGSSGQPFRLRDSHAARSAPAPLRIQRSGGRRVRPARTLRRAVRSGGEGPRVASKRGARRGAEGPAASAGRGPRAEDRGDRSRGARGPDRDAHP